MKRRRFLQGLGLAGVASGLSGLGLRSALATTAEGEAPRRLIVISHCHGWPYESWRMQPEGLGVDSPWALNLSNLALDAFSTPLAPLYDHRDRMLAIDGLSLATSELDVDGNRHDTGWVHAWTGNWVDFSGTDTRAISASIDQRVAAHIARPDRLPSLELNISAEGESGRPIAYAQNGARLPVDEEPDRVWQRLFGPSRAPDPLTMRQRGVLDFAHAEFKALSPRLAGAQRQKLEAHFELISRLSDRIEGMASLTCGTVPDLTGEPPTYDLRFDAFADLIGAAFACDITRVISLSLGEMPTADFGWDSLGDNVHKGIAHDIYNNAEKHQAMSDYAMMHAQQVARLVKVLESLPDTDGKSVMDNTLIVWGSELCDGWHGYRHYCPVLIGGSWHFDTGRYLYWPHTSPTQVLVPQSVSPTGYSDFAGMPHQHLLVSVAQAMGIDTDRFGVDHVQGQTGHWVDCTGPLPEIA